MKMNKCAIVQSLCWASGIAVIPLWFISYPQTTLKHNPSSFVVYLSQLLSLTGYVYFALSFLLSARSKWLEKYFGGLDKMLRSHHYMAIAAGILILLHPLLLAFTWIGEDPQKALIYIFPFHRRLAMNIGSYALIGMIALLAISIFKQIPYHIWRFTHKFFGLVFIATAFHVFMIDDLVWNNPWLTAYLLLVTGLAIYSWIYKSVVLDYILMPYRYTVSNVTKLPNGYLDIELSAIGREVHFKAGQFFFIKYFAEDISRESHPFTVYSSPNESKIKILSKALGDYTHHLYRTLKVGTEAVLEGPYGGFNFDSGVREQVWIAGGVGITPFLSRVQTASDISAELYYCVNTPGDAIGWEVFEEKANIHPNFTARIISADSEGFLCAYDIPQIKNKEIYICGPCALRSKIIKELQALKIPRSHIHFEDFDFI